MERAAIVNNRAHIDAAQKFSRQWENEGFLLSRIHEYTDESGKAIFWKLRLTNTNDPGKKIIRPMCATAQGDYVLAEPEFPHGSKPLYALHRLASTSGSPVMIVEGEACVDALARFCVLATTSGSSASADGADWTPLARRQIVIWPDNDGAGLKYANSVAAKLVGLGCTIRVVDIDKLGLPEKGDVVDWMLLNQRAKAEDIYSLPTKPYLDSKSNKGDKAECEVQSAELPKFMYRLVQANSILPEQEQKTYLAELEQIFADPGSGELNYPVDGLGPLANVCAAISDEAQLSSAVVGQCLLGTASLLTQGLANVQTLGGEKPISLNLITIALSGDGKTLADNLSLKKVVEWEETKAAIYVQKIKESSAQREGDEDRPKSPYRIVRDATVEALRRDFLTGSASQGCFTAEAGVMLCGYGMSPEKMTANGAVFNQFFDDGIVSASRATAGRYQQYGRRLTNNWLIQPTAANQAIYNVHLAELGFWPRFLLSYPQSTPIRKAKGFDLHNIPPYQEYLDRCAYLLDEAVFETSKRPIVESTIRATEVVSEFFEAMEMAAKCSGGHYSCIRPFALRATELAYRIAGVLAIFGGETSISESRMVGAIKLVTYSLETWKGLFGEKEGKINTGLAKDLYGWLLRRPGGQASDRAILGLATPRVLRKASVRDAALEVLIAKNVVAKDGDQWVLVRQG